VWRGGAKVLAVPWQRRRSPVWSPQPPRCRTWQRHRRLAGPTTCWAAHDAPRPWIRAVFPPCRARAARRHNECMRLRDLNGALLCLACRQSQTTVYFKRLPGLHDVHMWRRVIFEPSPPAALFSPAPLDLAIRIITSAPRRWRRSRHAPEGPSLGARRAPARRGRRRMGRGTDGDRSATE
jgi:hypothetical protein